MKKFFTLMTLLVALCSGAWAADLTPVVVVNENFDGGATLFTGVSRITVANDNNVKFSTANNSTNGYSSATYNFNTDGADAVKIEFAYWIANANCNYDVAFIIRDANVAAGHARNAMGKAGAFFSVGRTRQSSTNLFSINQQKTAAASASNLAIWCQAEIYIDLAAKKVDYKISNLSTGDVIKEAKGIDYLSSDASSVSQIDFFADVNSENDYLDNLLITKYVDPSTLKADYKVQYLCNGKEIKAASVRNGVVNSSISITDADKANLTVDGKKYIYASDDASGKTIADGGSTVVTVNFREAAIYNYSAKSQFGDVLYSGRGFEGDAVNYYFPRFLQKDGKLYEVTGNTYFQGSLTLDADNKVATMNYNETGINCAYYSEAELIEGITSFEDGYTNIRMSNGAAGYAAKDGTVITTVPAGVYKLTASTRSAKNGMKFFIGDVEAIDLVSTGAVVVTTSDNIIVTESANVTVNAGSSSHYFDYVLVEKVADYVPATGVTVSTETPSINIMQNAVLTANVLPASATITDVKWESSNNNIATVDQSGVVTPITSGTVTIYATDHLGHSASQTLTITPLKALVAIKDAPAADAKVIVGATKESKDQAADGEYVNVTSRTGWEGLVSTTQLNHEGSVWATEYNTSVYEILVEDLLGNENTNKIIKCIYTPDIQVEEMVMDTKSQLLVEGGSRVTGVSYFPADATFKTAKWSSSDESIAIVDAETGKVTAVGAGTCTITAAWSANAEHGTDISTSYTLTVFPKHSYDFFCWSDETMADVKADPMWVSTDEGKSYGSNFRNYSKTPAFLTANGKEIEELYGIKFLYPVEGQIGIAVNKGKNGENNYNGTQYLALNGLAAQMIIKNVKCGTQVVIGMESQYNEDYSQVQLDVNGKMVTPVRIHEKEFAEYKWTVPGTAADGVVDVVVRNYTSIGANIYYINCDVDHSLPLSLPTAVETVKTTTETPAKILTKTGIKVKGYGVDGK